MEQTNNVEYWQSKIDSNTGTRFSELPRFSASKLKTFRQCGKKFYYTYINKPPEDEHNEERNVGALLGTILHRVIETVYKDPSVNPLALYQEKMLTTLEEWQAANYTINGEQYFTKSMKDGREMLEKFDWNRFHPIALEKHFDLPYDNVEYPRARITGYIDLIDRNGFVVDHKSQKKVPSADDLANDAQMMLYRYAYHLMFGEYPKKIYWHNLRTGELVDTHVENDYDHKMLQLFHDTLSMEHHLDHPEMWYSRINLSDTCRRECGFYKLCWGGSNVESD